MTTKKERAKVYKSCSLGVLFLAVLVLVSFFKLRFCSELKMKRRENETAYQSKTVRPGRRRSNWGRWW